MAGRPRRYRKKCRCPCGEWHMMTKTQKYISDAHRLRHLREEGKAPDKRVGDKKRTKTPDKPEGLRTPAHGKGKLGTGGPKKNGGRKRAELRKLLRNISGAAGDEIARRLARKDTLEKLSIDELRLLVTETGKLAIGQPMKIEGTGKGGALPIAVIGVTQQ